MDIFAATEVYVCRCTTVQFPLHSIYGPLLQPPGWAGWLHLHSAPTSSELRTSLLSMVYDNVKNEVESCLSHEERVNVVFDESKDRAGHRISNMSLVTRLGAFYYLTDAVGETRQTAENVAAWAMQRMGQSVCRGIMLA
jgi:tetrahydromethanopterin S-methyltransferase subunit G